MSRVFQNVRLSREAVRIFTAVAVIAQAVAYVVTEALSLNAAGQLSVITLLGLISLAARKFVWSEQHHVEASYDAYVRGAADAKKFG